MNIKAVINPNARFFRKGRGDIAEVFDSLEELGIETYISWTLEDLPYIVKHAGEADCYCLLGGDGTIQRFISEHKRQHDTFPTLFVRKFGTIDVLAYDIGIRGKKLKKSMEAYADLAASNLSDIQTRDYGVLEASVNGHSEFGLMWATGDIDRFLKQYYRGNYGKFRYGMWIALGMASLLLPIGPLNRINKLLFDKQEVNVFYDGVSIEGMQLGAATASAHEFNIIGLKPYRASPDGEFNFFLSTMRPSRYPAGLYKCLRGDVRLHGITNAVDRELALVGKVDSTFSFESELFPWPANKTMHLRHAGNLQVVDAECVIGAAKRTRSGTYQAVRLK